jgi:coenzyme Q-binding protein COQ10
MPRYAENHRLPYSPAQMFELVSDVAKYPQFLPWCQGARVWKREGNVIYADLIIGFKMFREQFTSKVTLNAPDRISVEYVKGPLKHLVNDWKFVENPEGGCIIDFLVDFEFKSHLFERLVGGLFSDAVHHMIHSFETRADELYGQPKLR